MDATAIIAQIAGYLADADGETIAEIFNKVQSEQKATYIGDDMFEIEDENEQRPLH